MRRLGVLLLVASGCVTVPFPRPTGALGVGTTRYEVTELGFDDPYAPTPGPRRIAVQAWYPALTDGEAPLPNPEDDVVAAFAEVGVPRWLIPQVPSRVVPEAPPVPGRYPVLIFNHGFMSYPAQNASLVEELVSHGYVVLSVGHPYESLLVRYPDGGVVTQRRDLPAAKVVIAGLKDLERQVKEAEPLLVKARAARTALELREAMLALMEQTAYAALVPVMELWRRDTRVVIDRLAELDSGGLAPQLKGVVDAERLGVFGHSMGGMVSGALAMADPRVKAGMSYDGAQLVPAGEAPYRLRAPFCFVYADTTKVGEQLSTDDGMNDALVVDGPPGSCGASIRGATHLSFSDASHWPLFARGVGRIDRTEMSTMLRAMTLGFFDHHLKGAPLAGFTPSATLRVRWAPMDRP